jgi:phospholipid/cholesterol/gamma-HCH transport system substrate-binding protein/paraquat-inducible protein B
MSLKPNYFKIGVFVIIAVVLIVAAVVIFGAGLLVEEKMYFETYFDESVSGLSVGATVENMGVRMGQVDKITFAASEYKLRLDSNDFFKYQHIVMVVVSVDAENLPAATLEERKANLRRLISTGLRVRLASNLLTGQAYLQADYLDPKRFPVLKVPWEPTHLYVPSARGELSTLKQSVDRILFRLEKIETEKIGQLIEQILASLVQAIDDANVGEVSREIRGLFASSKKVIDDVNVPSLSGELQGLFAEARQTNQQLKKLVASEKIDSPAANLPDVIAQLGKTLRRIDKLVSSQTPQIEQALEDLRKVSANLEELTENLKKHPAELIFSQPPPKSEAPK